MKQIKTHYDTKVARDAPLEVVRAAYKTLSQKYHPDRHPGDQAAEDQMSRINVAYEVLSDAEKRVPYDLWIVQQESLPENKPAIKERPSSSAVLPTQIATRSQPLLGGLFRYALVGFLVVGVWMYFSDRPRLDSLVSHSYQGMVPATRIEMQPGLSQPVCQRLEQGQYLYACTHPDGTRSYSTQLPEQAFVKTEGIVRR